MTWPAHALAAGLVMPWLRPLIEQQIADEQAWCRLEAIVGPEAFPALAERIQGEYRWIVKAAERTPYPMPPLALVIEAHVLRVAAGETP